MRVSVTLRRYRGGAEGASLPAIVILPKARISLALGGWQPVMKKSEIPAFAGMTRERI
jgi:hypothetical protein